MDPFSKPSTSYIRAALHVAPEIRRLAERTVVTVYNHGEKARLHRDTLDYVVFAALRLDALGMKIEFSSEINHSYWDAYQHSEDNERVWGDLYRISNINALLEDMRDSTTRLRAMYSDLWLRDNQPYWLGNVTVSYDNLASEYAKKILEIEMVKRQFAIDRTLEKPEDLGLYIGPAN